MRGKKNLEIWVYILLIAAFIMVAGSPANAADEIITIDRTIPLNTTWNNNWWVENYATIMNEGTINNYFIFNNNSSATITGNYASTLNNNSGATLTNSGTFEYLYLNNNSGATLTNSGTFKYIYLNNYLGAILNNFGMMTEEINFNKNYGTFNNSGTFDHFGFSNYGTLTNSGAIYSPVGAGITNSGTLNNTVGGSISIIFGAIDNLSGATFKNSGSINFYRAPLMNRGTFNNTNLGGIHLASGDIHNFSGATFNNDGWIDINFDAGFNNEGTFNNTGTFHIDRISTNNYCLNYGSFTNSGTFINENTFTNSGIYDNSGTFTNKNTFTNSGTFTNTGILNNSGSITGGGVYGQWDGITTNTGNINQTVIGIQVGTFNQQSGSLSAREIINTAAFNLTGGSINIDTFMNIGGTFTGAGTINVSNFNNGGIVALGNSPGTLNIIGAYNQDICGILLIELGGLEQGISYDWLNITGTATLAGKLDIDLYNGYDPTVGDEFTFLMATGGIAGTFTFFDLPYGTAYWDIIYGSNFVKLSYLGSGGTSVPETASILLMALGLIGLAAFRKRSIH